MKIYLDSNYMCHTKSGKGRRGFNVPFFDGKCKVFIEGYRYVPSGETWEREDGAAFTGEMLSPATDYAIIAKAQEQHEADVAEHINELGSLIEEIYSADMEVINDGSIYA